MKKPPSTKASATGYIVTSGLAKLAMLPQWKPYFSEEMVRLNAAFVHYAKDSFAKQCVAAMSPRFAIWVMDNFFVPGLMQHYVARKRYIENYVTRLAANDVRQIINLGAGFDTLALRLAKQYSHIEFFEIDLPHTQAMKKRILGKISYDIPSNCHFLAADLSQTGLKEVLSQNGKFNADAPTLVILEGLLMYLTKTEVTSLFRNLYDIFGASLTIVYGATVASAANGNWSKKFINTLLKRSNEGAKWACPSDQMESFIHNLGYRMKEWIPYKQLQKSYRSPRELKNIPDEDENYYIIEKASFS